MDHLQSDIDSLESERGALRDKLKVYSSKKGDLKTTTALGKLKAKISIISFFQTIKFLNLNLNRQNWLALY